MILRRQSRRYTEWKYYFYFTCNLIEVKINEVTTLLFCHLLNDEPENQEDENAEEKEVEKVVTMARLGQLQHLADGFAQETYM